METTAYDKITEIISKERRVDAIDALTHALYDMLMQNPDKEDIIKEVGQITLSIIAHVKADIIRRGMN